MPYFGVKVDLEKIEIIVKLHGPLDTFVINTQQLKFTVAELASGHLARSNNIPDLCMNLAEDIKISYLNGNDLVWVEVEVFIKSNGVFFGASAEEVLVDTPG